MLAFTFGTLTYGVKGNSLDILGSIAFFFPLACGQEEARRGRCRFRVGGRLDCGF
jgi:hypothetical protein